MSPLTAFVALLLSAGIAAAHGRRADSSGTTSGPVLMASGQHIAFQVIGDWGRQGEHNQTNVAAAMALSAAHMPPEFVISTGDNFYPSGLVSAQDSQFDYTFIDVFNASELQVPWLAVLGNHDYGDGIKEGEAPPQCPQHSHSACFPGPLHQVGAELARRDSRWFCRRSFKRSLAGGALDIFFYDTTPFVQYYYVRSWAANTGGLLEQSWRANLAELEADLAASTAGWKLVVGHHPIRSNGEEHGDTPELREHVEPLLEKYGVQLYFAGHDHDLEHVHSPGSSCHHILSGAGSQCRGFTGAQDAIFQHPAAGFVTVDVGRDTLQVSFQGIDGAEALHTSVIARVPPAHTLWEDSVAALEDVFDLLGHSVEVSTSSVGAVLKLHDAL